MEHEQPYSYREQILWVLLIEAMIVAGLMFVSTFFWTSICGDSLKSCVDYDTSLGPIAFLLLSALRPFVFTPFFFMGLIAGPAFGTLHGTAYTLIGGLASTVIITGIGRILGKQLVTPWMTANLPQTSTFIRQQDYKIAFFLRLVPLVPFDLASLFFGALGFRWRHIFWTTLAGSLPEALLFARMSSPTATLTESAFDTLALIAVAVILPLAAGEFLARRNGRSMWQQARLVYMELVNEVRRNNRIKRRANLSPDRTPILLLYGFFSTRRSLGILERHLIAKGYDVISFNLGGLLGTFFTSSILDSATFIDGKIKRQLDRHGIKNIHIVAHSKGGLVALWWLLRMGGNQFCKKVVTLGTPFKGSRLTYLALITPLGLIWRDMWQMRPGSAFLKQLDRAPIPQGLDIYCFHSTRDGVATGKDGLYQPEPRSSQVHPIQLDEVSHFEFLSSRGVVDQIAAILGPPSPTKAKDNSESNAENVLLQQG
jgi:uncharacterized membrane protein YdjX (TVP38/TMEM64 family)/pimeloyl-ACP methyl ester carboxylesterase